MKEQLYTIPVTDAFNEECECPICVMKKTLETNAIDYTMGPSYMEDDVRAETDKTGFCQQHIRMLYENQNRLGLALILSTHLDKTVKHIEELIKKEGKASSPSLFKKKSETSEINTYIDTLEESCFVCNRINQTFHRYLLTIFYLYKTEPDFQNKFRTSKGICTTHYGILYKMAPEHLKGDTLSSFIDTLNQLYLDNMKRIQGDLEWFIDKFDYRNNNAPWKNSQDALPRTITKVNSII